MGEARSRLRRLLRDDPNCVYCGGVVPSTSCDHCPPISVFDGRQRPAGLEFGCCADCHEGTRQMDNIVAMLSRLYPEATTRAARAEVNKYIAGFVNNHRDLADIFRSDGETIMFRGAPATMIDISKETRLNSAMSAFAARLGLALYRHTIGKPAPVHATVAARWYSNHDIELGEYPEEMVAAMGAPKSLQMGRQHVYPQFRYWAGTPPDSTDYFASFAVFRESFATICIIRTDVEALTIHPRALHPGFLKGFRV
jgi:hypothetical protein